MLIIPEPVSLEERDFDSLTREEMQELHKRARDRLEVEKVCKQVGSQIHMRCNANDQFRLQTRRL